MVDGIDVSVLEKKEERDQHLPFCSTCSTCWSPTKLSEEWTDVLNSPVLAAPRPTRMICSGSSASIATCLDLELLQFFCLIKCQKQLQCEVKNNNYADALRVGPSTVLLQFLLILS